MTATGEQLGAFLRSRRERLSPASVGLTDGRRRRTPGLRREEVASLAGISAEWYLKLEQGRAVAPSSATVDALARALQLTEAEQAHLRALARGEKGEAWSREVVPVTLQRLIDALDYPAYVTGLRWDLLAWNQAAGALFGTLDELSVEHRNILYFSLVDPRGRTLFGAHWAEEARRMVALFRATYDRRASDPAFARLVALLDTSCPEFKTWWNTHDVATPISGVKSLLHPVLGQTHYTYTTFQANDDPQLKLVVYMT